MYSSFAGNKLYIQAYGRTSGKDVNRVGTGLYSRQVDAGVESHTRRTLTVHDVFSVLPPTKKTHDLSDAGEVATPGVLRACQAANCDSERVRASSPTHKMLLQILGITIVIT